jgi:hypothetical protein
METARIFYGYEDEVEAILAVGPEKFHHSDMTPAPETRPVINIADFNSRFCMNFGTS